jgi:hypothetical protein
VLNYVVTSNVHLVVKDAARTMRQPVPIVAVVQSLRSEGSSARELLSLAAVPFLDKDVVRDGVPGIVNANEEQQQRRSANEE